MFNTNSGSLFRVKLLRVILYLASAFYFIGSIAHYFGLTIFPWFDSALYSSYHDSIIAMASLALSVIIFLIARHPDKYSPLVKGISLVAIVNGLLTIYMVYTINWAQYSSAYKQTQALVEGVLLIILAGALYVLNRKLIN
ncbi:MAG: hypothetical protein WC575_02010 [Patescibacteria group bacterium]